LIVSFLRTKDDNNKNIKHTTFFLINLHALNKIYIYLLEDLAKEENAE